MICCVGVLVIFFRDQVVLCACHDKNPCSNLGPFILGTFLFQPTLCTYQIIWINISKILQGNTAKKVCLGCCASCSSCCGGGLGRWGTQGFMLWSLQCRSCALALVARGPEGHKDGIGRVALGDWRHARKRNSTQPASPQLTSNLCTAML